MSLLSDPTIVKAEENSNIVLVPPKYPTDKLCNEKLWFMYASKDNYPRLAHLQTGQSVNYYGNFCNENISPCSESSKLKLNPATGDLTLNNIQLNDEENYFYYCGVQNQWPTYDMVRLEVHGE